MTTAFETSPVAFDTPAPPQLSGSRWGRTRERIALAALLVGTALMYVWNITINGMGNKFYAGAAWAGSQNWKALLFGSLDPHNFITVDKPPVSQWVMGLCGQLFGFSSASMLIPQALMAVASVALLYGAVRRISGPPAALLAGAALALTPVAALMFRYNNPDAVMVMLMLAGAYCTVRALERASARWIALAGVALAFAFLAKMLEGLMVMPALGLAYLIAAPAPLGRRLLHLLGALAGFAVSAAWFVGLTLVWPTSSRPYIAGSTDNNFMNLVLGYNGLSRVLGSHAQPDATPGPAAPEFDGFGERWHEAHGLPRLFSGEFGFQIGWLLPAAVLAILLVLISRGGAPRTDVVRAGTVVFGAWLFVNGVVLSFMQGMHGVIPPYYCLSLAPPVAAMFAIGVAEMWRNRSSMSHRFGLAAMLLATGVWSWWILGRNAGWLPALRWVILAVTVIAGVAMLWSLLCGPRGRLAAVSLAAALVGALAGTTAYAIATTREAHAAGGASVGPACCNPSNGAPPWQNPDNPQLNAMLGATHTEWSAAIKRSSLAASLELSTHTPVMAVGGFLGIDPDPTLGEFQNYVANHQISYYVVPDPNDDHFPVGRDAHMDIANWVAANFKSVKLGTDTVYDLTAPVKRSDRP